MPSIGLFIERYFFRYEGQGFTDSLSFARRPLREDRHTLQKRFKGAGSGVLRYGTASGGR
ncbi:MAG: hypothetical protein A4E39_01316 [Methanoregulaceae archaeon PtaB.Bin152]|nr:MAG: hypothetical protein A4E39_01316 [Methanoregulaceae archaeon PtaB.Bin152]